MVRIRPVTRLLGIALIAGMGCSQTVTSTLPGRITATLESAELALARGEAEHASRQFDRILVRDPENARALRGSARAHLAAGRGERSVERFAACRANAERWSRSEQWEYCSALVIAVEQVLDDPERPTRAFELATQLENEDCAEPRSSALLLQSGLAVADASQVAGDLDRALGLYLELSKRGDAAVASDGPADEPVASRRQHDDPLRARAYVAASGILLETGRREEALVLLRRGLDELPGNRDLVHIMVSVLADGSSVVFPRAKPPVRSSAPTPE